jgi:hypothetical protein
VNYTTEDRSRKTLYTVRAFVATGDMCGDLELYSNTSIKSDGADLKKILASYELDAIYIPKFTDILLYTQVLYKAQMYKAAAPIFEMALAKLYENPESSNLDPKTMRRVVIDRAGMSYGMSGDIRKRVRSSRKRSRKILTIRCITTILPAPTRKRKSCPTPAVICSRHSPTNRMESPAKKCPTRRQMIRSHSIAITKTSGRSSRD